MSWNRGDRRLIDIYRYRSESELHDQWRGLDVPRGQDRLTAVFALNEDLHCNIRDLIQRRQVASRLTIVPTLRRWPSLESPVDRMLAHPNWGGIRSTSVEISAKRWKADLQHSTRRTVVPIPSGVPTRFLLVFRCIPTRPVAAHHVNAGGANHAEASCPSTATGLWKPSGYAGAKSFQTGSPIPTALHLTVTAG